MSLISKVLRRTAFSTGTRLTIRERHVTHRRLLQVVWGPDYGDESECLRVQISQLRKRSSAIPADRNTSAVDTGFNIYYNYILSVSIYRETSSKAQIAAYLLRVLAMAEGGIETPIGEWEVRGR